MADDKPDQGHRPDQGQGRNAGGFLGSLREALAAAGRDDPAKLPERPIQAPRAAGGPLPPPLPVSAMQPAASAEPPPMPKREAVPLPSAAEAAREARGGTPNIPAIERALDRPGEGEQVTKVIRSPAAMAAAMAPAAIPPAAKPEPDEVRTQLVRGKPKVARGEFATDPVVGWLVVVGGPGLGAFRPVFEGNNTVGRSPTQRVPIDFGDEAISSEEQAYIRYDSAERTFLFVPNLSKTNVVQVNSKRPTSAVALTGMDVIVMGRTQLVFVPFCGAEFDWAELVDVKS
jgi:hypothetical protein